MVLKVATSQDYKSGVKISILKSISEVHLKVITIANGPSK